MKILVVGDPASIHTARFVDLLQSIGYQIRVFQSEHYYSQDEHLHDVKIYVSQLKSPPINGNILYDPASFEIESKYEPIAKFLRLLERLARYMYRRGIRNIYGRGYSYVKTQESRSNALSNILVRWNPDIVISLKMQNDGYTVSEAKDILGDKFPAKWIHFNWGTDIEFFGKNFNYSYEHLPKIRKLLSHCDFHLADCQRDARQAFQYGFLGQSLGVCLANGGYDIAGLKEIIGKASPSRKIILIKGRQGGLVGKAFNIFEALHRIPHIAREYEIKVILADSEASGAAKLLSKIDGLSCEVMQRIPYQELLGLFAESKMAISASDVDGTPSFLTEAMAMGALPIHSDMESIREWVTNGVNGLLFPVDDIAALVSCIERAHIDQQLFDSAKVINWNLVTEQMNRSTIAQHVQSLVHCVIDSAIKAET